MPLVALETRHVKLALYAACAGWSEHIAVIAHDVGVGRVSLRHGTGHHVQSMSLGAFRHEVDDGRRLVGERTNLIANGSVNVAECEQLDGKVFREDDQLTAIVCRGHEQ